MSILIEVSYGELIDKITILEIKAARIQDPVKLKNVSKERALLESTLKSHLISNAVIDELTQKLRTINGQLWDVEDELRKKEQGKIFDDKFIELARSVYFTNDQRAKIKRELNVLLDSAVFEEKSYQSY